MQQQRESINSTPPLLLTDLDGTIWLGNISTALSRLTNYFATGDHTEGGQQFFINSLRVPQAVQQELKLLVSDKIKSKKIGSSIQLCHSEHIEIAYLFPLNSYTTSEGKTFSAITAIKEVIRKNGMVIAVTLNKFLHVLHPYLIHHGLSSEIAAQVQVVCRPRFKKGLPYVTECKTLGEKIAHKNAMIVTAKELAKGKIKQDSSALPITAIFFVENEQYYRSRARKIATSVDGDYTKGTQWQTLMGLLSTEVNQPIESGLCSELSLSRGTTNLSDDLGRSSRVLSITLEDGGEVEFQLRALPALRALPSSRQAQTLPLTELLSSSPVAAIEAQTQTTLRSPRTHGSSFFTKTPAESKHGKKQTKVQAQLPGASETVHSDVVDSLVINNSAEVPEIALESTANTTVIGSSGC